MAQAERAIQALYEDAGLLDELTDSDAQLLMQWAGKQIEALAGRGMDDEVFDEAVSQLRQLLTRINRYVGRHAYLTPDEERDWITKIVESAAAMGYNIPVEQMSAQVNAQAAPDSRTLLTGLLQMMDSAQAAHEDVGATWQIAPTDAPLHTESDTGAPNGENTEPQK